MLRTIVAHLRTIAKHVIRQEVALFRVIYTPLSGIGDAQSFLARHLRRISGDSTALEFGIGPTLQNYASSSAERLRPAFATIRAQTISADHVLA